MSDWPPADPPPPSDPSGPPGPGWWLASDGNYYPPEQAPGATSAPPPTAAPWGSPSAPPPTGAPFGAPPPFTPYTPYAPGVAQSTSTNGLAIAAMVLGILWIYWIGSILALVFGYVAKGQINRSGGRQGGKGMAIAGIVLGWIGVGFLILFVIFAFAVGDSVDDLDDGINSDPPDGFCDEERFIQDPDC